ncbi:MAG: bis(5'-nucleosyl)-tetraphosphatase (symmetrical) YqeK [Clostridiales Family XIII bacterium]|jgi:ribosome silencing factor RsfS/YbeB/iojap|nr:bis(5'-nucleosyl)-tetraphosphatase (symmetrical) YqeK [Clostridiales Family XIII bacterium]
MKEDCISREALEARLGKGRAAHVAGTARMAAELAEIHGADAEKAKEAALLHDLFRAVSAGELDALIDRYGEDPALKGDANLSHGKVAAAWMKAERGTEDAELLNAVRYHTTGRAGMSKLEKILYVADAAEPTRDYAGVEELRKRARDDLDGACVMALENTLRHLREKGVRPHPDSRRALAWFAEARSDVSAQSVPCGPAAPETRAPQPKRTERGDCLDSKELALSAAGVLSQKKGIDVVILDIAEKSSFADYLVLASGNSVRQVGSLAEDVADALAERGTVPSHIEGKPESGWILLDCGDVIVNVFTKEQRDLYRIEQIWGDGNRIEVQEV